MLTNRKSMVFHISVSVLLVHALSFILVQPLHAEGPEGSRSADTSNFVWRSSNQNSAELAKSITSLYLLLCEEGLLETKTVPNPDGLPLSKIMERESAFLGPIFTQEMDELLCVLNPDHCQSQRTSHDATRDSTMPFCGYPVASENRDPQGYRPIWTNAPGDDVVVPTLEFEPTVSFEAHSRVTPRNIENVLQKQAACPLEAQACLALTEKRNWRVWDSFLNDEFDGRLQIPTLGARAVVVLHANEDVIEALQENLVAPGIAKTQASSSQNALLEVRARQRKIFDSISHPKYVESDVRLGTGRVTVVVFDRWVDSDHCALDRSRLVGVYNHNTPNSRARSGCYALREAPEPWHHGTHIVGLLAAKEEAAGLLSFGKEVEVVSYELMFEPLFNVEWNAGIFVREDGGPFDHRPSVFNLSFSYEHPSGRADPFRAEIEKLRDDAVVVVAAGNENKFFVEGHDDCQLHPACWGRGPAADRMTHLISVVALNEKSEIWKDNDGDVGSNHGTWFDIAAPGVAVPSTLRWDQVGTMSGTSQAAGLVSGAAALLMTKKVGRVPAQARNRLIYTSDLLPHLYDKVYGGRLNIARAMNTESDVVKLREGSKVWGWPGKDQITADDVAAGRNTFSGKITNGKCSLIYFAPQEGEQGNFAVAFEQIKRLSYDQQYEDFVLFYSKNRNDVTNPVKRLRVTLRHKLREAYRLRMQVEIEGAKREVQFRVPDIEDYTTRTKNGGFEFNCHAGDS